MYALGSLGWIQIAAFLTSAIAYGSLVIALRRLVRGVSGWVGLAVLGICAVGTVGVGVFVTDPMTVPIEAISTRGVLHILFGSTALFFLPVAALLLNLSLARTLTHARRVLRATAALPLAGFAVFVFWQLVPVLPPDGLPPRFLLATYAIWLITLAVQVIRTPAR